MAKRKIRWRDSPSGEPEEWQLMQLKYVRCCDCGLVHMYYVDQIYKTKVIIKGYRDDYLTEKLRKKEKK